MLFDPIRVVSYQIGLNGLLIRAKENSGTKMYDSRIIHAEPTWITTKIPGKMRTLSKIHFARRDMMGLFPFIWFQYCGWTSHPASSKSKCNDGDNVRQCEKSFIWQLKSQRLQAKFQSKNATEK
jgi:hypothetical protein